MYFKNKFYIKIYIYLKIDVFYFNQFLHNLSNLILIYLKELKLIICMFIKQMSLKKLVI